MDCPDFERRLPEVGSRRADVSATLAVVAFSALELRVPFNGPVVQRLDAGQTLDLFQSLRGLVVFALYLNCHVFSPCFRLPPRAVTSL